MTTGFDQKKRIYLIDRSGAEIDDQCGMRFWWERMQDGVGIQPIKEAIPLAIGREVHKDFHAIAQMEDLRPGAIQDIVDDILSPITDDDKIDQTKMELLYRRLGWLVAFALYIEPATRLKYDTVGLEEEILLDRDPLFVPVTPDRVLRAKDDHHLVYREYKSALSTGYKWSQSWPYQIQLHLGIAAVQEALAAQGVPDKITFGQVMGMQKGYTSTGESGRLMHPYVWGYYRAKDKKWEWEYEKSRGPEWIPMPVWESEGGIVEWVRKLGPEVALGQFPVSAPVFLNQQMLDRWVKRQTHRRRFTTVVRERSQLDLNTREEYFESRTRHCAPAFGDPCPFRLACWNASANRDPLGTGEYVKRIPHHQVEIEARKEGLIT